MLFGAKILQQSFLLIFLLIAKLKYKKIICAFINLNGIKIYINLKKNIYIP